MHTTCLVAKTIMQTGCIDYLLIIIKGFSLSQQAFACVIEQLPFPLKVDIFAFKYSIKLSHYVSRYFDPTAWKVDAFSFPWPISIYVSNLVWWSWRYCIYYPCLEISIYLPSLFDLLIDNSIFIPSHQLAGPLPTRWSFNVMVWPISVYSVKRTAYQSLLSKRCSKILIPKLFPNIQGSGTDFIFGLTFQKMFVKLIDPRWMIYC